MCTNLPAYYAMLYKSWINMLKSYLLSKDLFVNALSMMSNVLYVIHVFCALQFIGGNKEKKKKKKKSRIILK